MDVVLAWWRVCTSLSCSKIPDSKISESSNHPRWFSTVASKISWSQFSWFLFLGYAKDVAY